MNSIVGYIVGIGDRHSENILIDNHTAEVIHIDFGVTFEQGKFLRTPEKVPFRLTRDVVDGFGVTGTQGVFAQCCTSTLDILRANSESVLTICGVFLHDPLYKWTEIHGNVQRDVEEGDQEAFQGFAAVGMDQNREAKRVLLRTRQKLVGDDFGGATLDVSTQVNRIIQEATSEENLCVMFYGWCPFL